MAITYLQYYLPIGIGGGGGRRGREDRLTRWSSSSAARNMDGPFLSIVHTSSLEGKEGGNQLFLGEKEGLRAARPSNVKHSV